MYSATAVSDVMHNVNQIKPVVKLSRFRVITTNVIEAVARVVPFIRGSGGPCPGTNKETHRAERRTARSDSAEPRFAPPSQAPAIRRDRVI